MILLTSDEVCSQLRICKKTLQSLRKNRKIVYVMFGHHSIRFRQEDIEKFIRRREKAVKFAEEEF